MGGVEEEGRHLEGEQDSFPLSTPKVRQDGGRSNGENQTEENPDLTTRTCVNQKQFTFLSVHPPTTEDNYSQM